MGIWGYESMGVWACRSKDDHVPILPHAHTFAFLFAPAQHPFALELIVQLDLIADVL